MVVRKKTFVTLIPLKQGLKLSAPLILLTTIISVCYPDSIKTRIETNKMWITLQSYAQFVTLIPLKQGLKLFQICEFRISADAVCYPDSIKTRIETFCVVLN